jgi:RNA polymerase sigma-70 factor (ECF subfamily)
MAGQLGGRRDARRAAAAERDQAFLEVLRAEHDLLARTAFGILKNEDDTNDVLAEAVANVYAKWRRGKVDDLAHYLTRTVSNTAIGRTRKRKSQLRALDRLVSQATTTAAADEQAVLVDLPRLEAQFCELSDDCQAVIRMRILEQRPIKEVAEELQISEGTVKSRCSRCLKQLGRSMGV